MIAAPEKELAETAPKPRARLLPPFGPQLKVAAMANGVLLAVLLLLGYPRLAMSEVAGCLISVLVCGILYLMVGRGMAYYVDSLNGQGSSSANSAVMAQMTALLLAKFLVLGLAVYAVMSVHGINAIGVLVGFLVTHTAIITAVSRQMKKR